jgi:predicted extracellular nuclease
LIVNHLRSPDVIAIEEIQDSDGPDNTSITDATTTWNMLIAAIAAEGGPAYRFRQIDPVDDQDGGEPGGNIRVGFLFRTDRGLEFIDRPGGTPTSNTTVIDHPSGPRLSASPGRIQPTNTAFNASRKPLAGEFRMRGKKVFVIANHFNSKGGDQPLFGRFQPPVRSSEAQRHQQAQIVNDFVDDILDADANANVIVLGDINDFEFSETVEILEGGVLTSLMNRLPKPERYSYVFEGNSQVLDQILASDNVLWFPVQYDVVHVNAEFAVQASDHDPQVARIDFRGRPRP